jgi:hypothetical protein
MDWRAQYLAFVATLKVHGKRFDLEFLKYINVCPIKWNVDIGLPYGTSYWHVGDSSEQNGCFKMALNQSQTRVINQKRSLVRFYC